MLSCIKTEFQKLLYLPYILLPIAGVLILCLSATGTTAADGSEVSIFFMMISSAEAGYRESIEGSSLWLWRQGIGSWLIVFLPLLLTFGYLMQLSSERQNGQLNLQLIRSGNLRWCAAKIISGALFGGFLFLAAYALFGMVMRAAFPAFSSFSAEDQGFYLEWYFGGSVAWYITKRLLGAFLYGIFGSVFGIGFAIFFRDKYMLLCLPFLMNYVCRQLLLKLEMDAWAVGAETIPILEALFPDNILNVSANSYWALTVMLMLLAYAGLMVLFSLSMKITPKSMDS